MTRRTHERTNYRLYTMSYSQIRYLQRHAREVMQRESRLWNVHLFEPTVMWSVPSNELGRAIVGLAAVMSADQIRALLHYTPPSRQPTN